LRLIISFSSVAWYLSIKPVSMGGQRFEGFMIKTVLAVVAILLTSACASVTGPGKQQVKVETVPPGAEVRINNQVQTSPAVFTLKGKSDYTVIAEKDGYKTSTGVINGEPRIMASVFGNILWLIPGLAIDYLATGAAYDLDDRVVIPMRPENEPANPAPAPQAVPVVPAPRDNNS
jgi:hypothetical protein